MLLAKCFTINDLRGAQGRNRTVDPVIFSLSSPALLLLDPPVDVLGEDLRGKRTAPEDGFVEAADVEAGAEGGFGVAGECWEVPGPLLVGAGLGVASVGLRWGLGIDLRCR